ncbi:MAG TPA: methylmalonyl-CoA epimerase [Bacillota bacterium]
MVIAVLERIDHIGIAVDDLDAALVTWERLGLIEAKIETIEDQGVRVAMLKVGDGKVELLAPLGPDTPVGRFLARKGPGLHHVAFRVDDIEAALVEARSRGLELIDETPRLGAGGARIAFLHPRAAGGTLVELCQR